MSYAIRASCVAFSVFTCFPSTAQPQMQHEFDLRTSGDAAPGSLLWAIRQEQPEVAGLSAGLPGPALPAAMTLFVDSRQHQGDAREEYGARGAEGDTPGHDPEGEGHSDPLSASVVPEPATVWLLLAGLLGIVGLKGRRQSRF
ncbi:MAG: PEP-CTERM sorting domain-containing protein [Pseudomonadota bacterium]|nr:PEP-CTERM sorting domain-containing protein [Pseudomonadota bacterium]